MHAELAESLVADTYLFRFLARVQSASVSCFVRLQCGIGLVVERDRCQHPSNDPVQEESKLNQCLRP